MAEEEAAKAKNPKTAEETQVLNEEELTRIVGGNGNDGNGNGEDANNPPPVLVVTSNGPDWSSDG